MREGEGEDKVRVYEISKTKMSRYKQDQASRVDSLYFNIR
jgi:hypothetical protein